MIGLAPLLIAAAVSGSVAVSDPAAISGAAAVSGAAADSGAAPITLAEALAMAQQRAPAVVQAQGARRTSAAAVRSAYAAFLPSLSLSAGSTRQVPAGGDRTIVENGQVVILPSQPWSFNLGLSANVDLFTGGRRFFDLRQARAQASAAEFDETATRYDVALGVKQAYFNVLAARESETAALAQLEQAEQQWRVSIAKVRVRSATRSDSLRAEIQVRSARLALLDARTSQVVAGAALTRTIGAEHRVTAAPDDGLGASGLALGEAELQGLAAASPAVRQAEAALTAAQAARKGAWTDYLPSVNAGYSRGGSGISSSFAPGGTDYTYSGSVRVGVSFPIFDQLRREAQVTQARVAEENAAANLRDARLAASEGLAQALGTYRLAEEQVASQEATVEAADEDLRVQQQRYGVGESTLLDVMTSQTQLNQARRDLVRARYDQRVAKAQLEALVGRDL